tara:strand:+ start:1039 stop:1509 length:471 start_codon:yes stop_codon:yes gene_type:complete
MRRFYLAICLSLPITLASCGNPATVSTPTPPQDPYLRVATALRQIMETDRVYVNTVIKSNDQKLIPDAQTRTLLETGDKVAKAGDQAILLTRGLTTLPPGTKVDIWTIMRPLVAVVNGSISTGLVPINDESTKATIQGLLLTMQTALAVIQLQTAQ